jgi:hypothetical protein
MACGNGEKLRRGRQAAQSRTHAAPFLGIQNQGSSLLNERTGQWIYERTLRQDNFNPVAATRVAAFVPRHDLSGNTGAAPWVVGQIESGFRLPDASGA